MIDHYEQFFAGYMHKQQYEISVERKDGVPIVLKQSTDYVRLCECAIEFLKLAKKNTIITIR